MFSTRKYNKFSHLLIGLLLTLMSVLFSSAYAVTTLHISIPDGLIATSIQTYTNTGVIPISATIQENNSILFSTLNATPENWSAEFIAPFDKKLEVTNYEGATRPDVAPDNIKSPTKPGLNISIGSTFRQCINAVSGRFDVLEVSYNPNGTLKTLAIDFVQYCDTDIATKQNPLRGSIRHNSDLPIETLVPIASAGVDQHVVEKNIVDLTTSPVTLNGNSISLIGSNSSAGKNATISSYQWTQISGPSITFIDTSKNTSRINNPDFNIPMNIKLAGEELVFELTVTNSNGITDTDQVSIFVASQSDPQTSFFFESDPGDYVGNGRSVYLDTDDAVFSVDNSDPDHAHVSIDNGPFWFADFGAITGSGGLIVDTYKNVVRHPDSSGISPSLSIHSLAISCANISGQFIIRQNNRAASDRIENLKVEFTQICNRVSNPIPTPQLTGVIKYNYIDVSVPTADAGARQSVTEASLVTLDATNSIDADGAIEFYEWTQLSGTTVTLSDNAISTPTFTAPDFALRSNEDLVFQVTVTDDRGFKAKNSVSISIKQKGLKPPVGPTPTNNPADGGGGGCSLNPNAKFDGSLLLLLLLTGLIRLYRYSQYNYRH